MYTEKDELIRELLNAANFARIALKNRDQSEFELKVLAVLQLAITNANAGGYGVR